jgi:hypothetical protein
MKKDKKKLKLTKLTVTNLDRLKGGDIPYCACEWTTDNGAYNQVNTKQNPCPVTGPGCEI